MLLIWYFKFGNWYLNTVNSFNDIKVDEMDPSSTNAFTFVITLTTKITFIIHAEQKAICQPQVSFGSQIQ